MKNSLIYILLLLFACAESQHPKQAQFLNILKDLDVPQNNREIAHCLIIPNGGCSGCISSAEAYVMENLDKNPQLFVVFTAIQSKKLLKSRLGDLYSHPRVRVDVKNVVLRENLNSIYPMIYHFQAGKLLEVEDLDPENIQKYQ